MERLIADAKPASRHLIGLTIIQDIAGYAYTGVALYDGDIITVYPDLEANPMAQKYKAVLTKIGAAKIAAPGGDRQPHPNGRR